MKFNSVTWYSKLIAAILFIALPFVGFYAGMKYQEATSPSEINVPTNSNNDNSGGWETVVDTGVITVKTRYESGKIKYTGVVQTPTPCHTLKDETMVLQSFPEQVQIRILIIDPEPSVVCAQVITDK